eukprot:362366-Chlamydomonas_euryale.AAC.4
MAHGKSENGKARPNAANTVPADCTAKPSPFDSTVLEELSNTTESGPSDVAVEARARPPARLKGTDWDARLEVQPAASCSAPCRCRRPADSFELTTPELASFWFPRLRAKLVPDSANQAGKRRFNDGGARDTRGAVDGVPKTPSALAISHGTGTHVGGVPHAYSPAAHGATTVIARSTVMALSVPELASTTVNHVRNAVPTAALVLMSHGESPTDASRWLGQPNARQASGAHTSKDAERSLPVADVATAPGSHGESGAGVAPVAHKSNGAPCIVRARQPSVSGPRGRQIHRTLAWGSIPIVASFMRDTHGRVIQRPHVGPRRAPRRQGRATRQLSCAAGRRVAGGAQRAACWRGAESAQQQRCGLVVAAADTAALRRRSAG